MIYTLYEFSRIYLFVCSVTLYLNQVFRHCFSMDNLRASTEDDSASSPSMGQLAKRTPPSTEGLSTSSSSRTSSMAVHTTQVTSGPVPEVSAPTWSASTVLQDKTVTLEDLPPPPPPAEPYEQFLARVSWELATLPVGPPRRAAAGPPQLAVPIPTTGSRLPMPFPRYEDSSWAFQPQAPVTRIRMPLPASCYVTPPSPWNWPGWGPAVPAPQVRGPAPPTSTTGPLRLPGLAALPIGPPATGPMPALPPPSSSHDLKSTSCTPPRTFEDFFPGATPLLSRWRLRPVRTLRLLCRYHRMLGTFSKVLLRRWFKAGKPNGLRI